LGRDVPPGDDVTLAASVVAPHQPGTYVLKWDMLMEDVFWFSWGDDWPRQVVTVTVEPAPGTTYLPDLKANWEGWSSTILVRNHGTEMAHAYIAFYDPDGNPIGTLSEDIPARGLWTLPLESGQFEGAALLDADQEVSVVVYNTGSGQGYSYTGIAPADSPDAPSFAVADTELYLPIIFYGHSGWYSHIVVQNTSTDPTTVTLSPENRSSRLYTIPPAGVLFLDDELSYLGAPYYGSVRMTSDRPVAVVVSHRKEQGSTRLAIGHNGAALGRGRNFHPILFNEHADWLSGVPVRNVGSSSTTVTLKYYYQSGTYTDSQGAGAGSSVSFYLPEVPGAPQPSYGQGMVRAGQPLVSVANQTNYVRDVALGYNGFVQEDGSGQVILPLVSNGGWGLRTGVAVQNVGSQGTNVTITFYDENGNEVCSEGPVWISPKRGASFYQPEGCVAEGFRGSAEVRASGGDKRIVAEVNATNYGAGYAFGYSGINR